VVQSGIIKPEEIGTWGAVKGAAEAGLVGGAASMITGGGFNEGFSVGAAGYLLNSASHSKVYSWPENGIPRPTQIAGDPDSQNVWFYHQNSGVMFYEVLDDDGSYTEYVGGSGYSGSGFERENPAYQVVENFGPIPEGGYTIGPIGPHVLNGNWEHPLMDTMYLTPDADNDMFGRGGFYIHGGSFVSYGQSMGCIALPNFLRLAIGYSGTTSLLVGQ
jgi:hypothetical protein